MSWSKFFKAVGKVATAAATSSAAAKPKTIPLMTMDMIQSNGEPITSAQAVKLFKEFSLKSGYLGKDELSEHAEYFSEEMKERGRHLEEDAAGEIADLKTKLKDLKARLKGETDKDTREQLDEEIDCAKEELDQEVSYRQASIEALAAFKADKRLFLIEYMNNQTQSN